MLLNCVDPNTPYAQQMRTEMENKYQVPVAAVNCMELSEEDIRVILKDVLFQFPVREVAVNLPGWVTSLRLTTGCVRRFTMRFGMPPSRWSTSAS